MDSKRTVMILLACSALTGALSTAGEPGGTNQVQTQFERMTQSYGHFSRTVVIKNRRLRLYTSYENMQGGTNALSLEQDRMLSELRQMSTNREALSILLAHPNPKVRTLALGAIFQREDGRDLPLIASLLGDLAETFPDLHESVGSSVPMRMSELVSTQTVGQVAQEMLQYWGTGGPMRLPVTTNAFAEYWRKYETRTNSASWFVVRMNRATRLTTPIQPEYRPDIQRVIAQMDGLPRTDRAWTRLFVLGTADSVPEARAEHRVVPDEEIVATLRELGPEMLLQFLQRKRVSDDPDLRFDRKDDEDFLRMSQFILRYADQLLRKEDADALLACEEAERDPWGGVSPWWSIGAARLQPDRAGRILRVALNRETRPYSGAGALLAAALWQIKGPAENSFLADWFYGSLSTNAAPQPDTERFLQEVRAKPRPDIAELLAALVKHPRFALTDWQALKEMLFIANIGRATPLVSRGAIYDAMPQGMGDHKMVLVQWRNLLRRECGVPEETAAPEPTKPKQILSEPTYSLQLSNEPTQMTVSMNGKLIGMLRGYTVEIRDAASGKLLWQVPVPPGTRHLGFRDTAPELVLVERDRLFSDWNLATHECAGRREVMDDGYGGTDREPHAFDRKGSRLMYAAYRHLLCLDVATGKALWRHPGDCGVGAQMTFASIGTVVAVGGGSDSQRTVRVFDAVTGEVKRVFDEFAGKVNAIALSADGAHLATSTLENGPQLWDVATGKLKREFAFRARSFPDTLIFSPDGEWLVIPGSCTLQGECRIAIFRVATGELQWEIGTRAQDAVGPWSTFAFSPDSSILYTASQRLEAWALKP